MKRLFTIWALMFIASSLFSSQAEANYPWLTFTLADNSEVSVPSDNLQLTYSEGVLQLKSTSVDQTLQLASLKSMRFEAFQSGIADIESNVATPIVVFNLNGMEIGTFHSVEGAVKNLPHGAYILRTGENSKKVMF